MDIDPKRMTREACRQLLRPITSMMLKCGMTWKEFSDLSKSVFVKSASDEYGIKGRPTNISRVSILTGISRKEVKHQRDLLMAVLPAHKGKTTDATRVLAGWHQDPLYVDSDRKPKLLPKEGAAPSFDDLCSRFAGDIQRPTMLKELLKTGSVEQNRDGQLRAIRRYYAPAIHDDEILYEATSLIKDLIETLNNDVFEDEARVLRFCRKADNGSVPLSAIPVFKKYLEKRGQAFIEDIDDWLTDYVAANPNENTECVRLGAGLFAIEDTKQ